MLDILVLHYSHRDSVRALAERIARGIESVPGVHARLRTVPRIPTVCEAGEPAVHHGMLPMGQPFTEADLVDTTTGAPPYGAGHIAGAAGHSQLSASEGRLAFNQGKRLANIVLKLGQP